jgi:hypothetical protein
VYALSSVGDGIVSGGADGRIRVCGGVWLTGCCGELTSAQLWTTDLSLLAEFVVGNPPTSVRSLHAADSGTSLYLCC